MKKSLIALLFSAFTLVTFSGCGTQETHAGGLNITSSNTNINNTNISNTNVSNELTIASLRHDPLLEDAIRRFEALHDDRYTIELVVYDDFTSYSQIITTAIMSGRGEDIISASHLTWQRLADVNMLLDLNNKMSFEPGIYYQSVLDAFIYNGGRYVLPLGFRIDAFRLNNVSAIDMQNRRYFTLDDMIALAHAYPDECFIHSPMGINETTIAHRFFELNFDEFIDLPNRTANVDSEKFINLLTDVQSIGDRLVSSDWTRIPLIQETMLHNIVMHVDGIEDYSDFHLMTNARGEGVARSNMLMAINASTQNPELATRFMQFLISEEVQSSPEMFATPVNRNAAQIVSRGTLEGSIALGFVPEGIDFDTNLAVFNAFADRLTRIGISDLFISDFVIAEMNRFFNGEVTAQQAASNLQARLTTYLNE